MWDEPHFSISAGENADADKDGEGAESATPSIPGETAQIIQQVALDEQPSSNNQGEQPDASGSATTPNQASTTGVSSTDQVAGTVPLPAGSAEGITSIVSDNLVFEINTQTNTATLVGSATTAPKGDLSVPASVTSGATTYEVTTIAKNTFANCPELTSVSLPATLREIDPDALAGCPSLKSISVSSKNDIFASSDGMLFTKDYSTLLLIPEGKEGAAIIPGETSSVPAQAFSRCLGIATLRTGDGGAELKAYNGMLFTRDLKTLLVCPAGVGSAVVLPAETEAIGEYALVGCKSLASITALGNVHTIDPTAFADETKATAVVALPAGEDYDQRKAIWEKAGFQYFAEPAQPGATTHPEPSDAEATSGLTFTLLDDYTLSVAWEGTADPDATLEIPASAEINGVTYQVSTIAPNAFVNRAMLTTVKLPASVTSLGEAAFAGCASLTSVDLPDTLQVISERAFEATALTEVWLPANIATIGPRAFAACESLTRIVALNTPEVADDALAACANLSIYCPYNESGTYPWHLGLLANNNHLLPYGLSLPEEPLVLEVGQQANLFENALYEVPEGCEVSYSYAAKPLSVENGLVTAKSKGSSEVIATIILDGQELIHVTRTVEVSSNKTSNLTSRTLSEDALISTANSDISLLAVGDKITSGSLTYKITSENPKTVAVSKCDTSATGSLSIPTSVSGYSVTQIEFNAFSYCGSVTSITIPVSVEYIGLEVFEYCSSLASINVNSSNTKYSSQDGVLFNKEKTKLVRYPPAKMSSHFSIPSSVTQLLSSAFQGCTHLSTISMSDSLTTIGDRAFLSCASLSAIDFPSSLKTIGSDAFYGCKSLTSVVIPSSVMTIVGTPFGGCTSLLSISVSESNAIYSSLDGVLYDKIKEKLISYPRGRPETSFNIPSSVTTIADRSFADCSALTEVTISDSVQTVGSFTFDSCTSLVSLTIGSGVRSLTSYAFRGAPLKDIYVRGNITAIDDDVFTSSKSSTKIHLPVNANRNVWISKGFLSANLVTMRMLSFSAQCDSPIPSWQFVDVGATAIEPEKPEKSGYAFVGWCQDKSETVWDFANDVMPDQDITLVAKWIPLEQENGDFIYTYLSDASLEVRARDVSSITVANIPATFSFGEQGSLPISRIKAEGFKGCAKLASVSIPSSVKSLEASAFEGCSSLIEVTLPTSVTSLGASAFKGCSKLENVTIPTSIKDLPTSAFEGCGFASIDLPNTLASVGERAFADCASLGSVVVPDSVTSLGASAFERCSKLRSVTFGARATALPARVLASCVMLSSVEAKGNVSTVASDAFEGVDSSRVSVKLTDPSITTSTLSNRKNPWVSLGLYKVSPYLLSFNSQGGSVVASQLAFVDKTVTAPEAPTLAGFIFGGWFADAGYESRWDFETDVMPSGDKMLFAKWIPEGEAEEVDGDLVYRMRPDGTLEVKARDVASIVSANIPAEHMFAGHGPYPVTTVAENGFKGAANLASVTFKGTNLISINISAFEDCVSLTQVRIPVSVTALESSAFSKCKALSSVKFEEGSRLKTIGSLAFLNCAFRNIAFPKELSAIDNYAFGNCTALTEVSLSDSVASLGQGVFSGCSNITTVALGLGVTSLPVAAFSSGKLTTISSTGKVTSIHDSSFTPLVKETATVILISKDFAEHSAVWTDAGFGNVVQAGTYTLSFDLSGAPGKVPPSQDIKPGEKATAPDDPKWDSSGSTFAGWYEDTDYSLRWDFETSIMPARDVTLHAKWEAPALMSVTAPINPCVVVELGGEVKPSTDTYFQSTGKIGARVSQVSCEVAEGADTLFPKGDATKVGVTVEEIADPANSFSVKPGGALAFVKGSKPDFSLKGRVSQTDLVSKIPVSVGLSIPEGTTMAPDTEASFARLVFTFEPLES